MTPLLCMYSNPIIIVDPTGEENIVVVGSGSTSGTAEDGLPVFLSGALAYAKTLKDSRTLNNEQTTIVVYRGEIGKGGL